MAKNRRRHTVAYKFRVAPEALEGSKTISQLSSEHEIYANLIRAWKRKLLEDGPSAKRYTWLGPGSSTPTRAHSSQPMPSPPACSQPTFKSASMAAAAPMTTSLRKPIAQRQIREHLSQPVRHSAPATNRIDRLFRFLQP